MIPRRRILAAAAVLAMLELGAATAAHADGGKAPVDGAARAELTAERVRVRAELDRVNAEIDALKRGQRGMRDDYRLRARLADAEALARRLTKIDAQLGPAAGSAAPRDGLIGAEPTLTNADGPAEMEAKADILADQARRIEVQVQALGQRVQQLRARQDLRRRVGQMEHDPFSPFERSKRLAPAAPATVVPGSSGAGAFQNNDRTGGAALPPGPLAPTIGGTASTSAGGRGGATPTVTPAGTGTSEALSVQLRDLLDPATLGEIRRLEASGAPGAGVEALERAAAALRARAERLQGQSRALRARARSGSGP